MPWNMSDQNTNPSKDVLTKYVVDHPETNVDKPVNLKLVALVRKLEN